MARLLAKDRLGIWEVIMDPEERGQPIRLENLALLLGALFSFVVFLKTDEGITTAVLSVFATWSFVDPTFSDWVGVFFLALIGIKTGSYFCQRQKVREDDHEVES